MNETIKDELKIKVAQLANEGKKLPHLAAILVGNSGASETYVASKIRNCEEIGFRSSLVRLDASASEEEILQRTTTKMNMLRSQVGNWYENLRKQAKIKDNRINHY
ncbi:MAG: hypothetical protein EOO01_20635 [Chitinophagaceae bacterium]|nr:MAG: hypothetical protein EOO01_20635 [Chitinophagaceae bacterium]